MTPEHAPENPKILMLNEQVICDILRGDTITNITQGIIGAAELRYDLDDAEILALFEDTGERTIMDRLREGARGKGFDDAQLAIRDPRMWQTIGTLQDWLGEIEGAIKARDLDKAIHSAEGMLSFRDNHLPRLGDPDYDALLNQAEDQA